MKEFFHTEGVCPSQAQAKPSQAQAQPSQASRGAAPVLSAAAGLLAARPPALLALLLLLLGSASPLPCAGAAQGLSKSKASAELQALGKFLEANGYGTFSAKIKAGALGQVVKDAVTNNSPITILAPLDSAWTKGSPSCRGIPTDTTLATHFIPGTLNISIFDEQPNGFIIGTFTAVPILKASAIPRKVEITTGALKVLTEAKIVQAEARASKWVRVHGIDTVLQYPCTF